jgi:peptidyl-prolyl cis-trans isomerase SurA
MVDPEIEAILAPLGKGGISPLTRTSGGYYIISVLADRIIGQSIKLEDSIVSLAMLTLPIPPGAPPKGQLMASASALTRNATSCAAFDEIAAKAGIARPNKIGPMRIAELSADLRPIASGLAANQVSPPQDVPAGIQVYMMCSREDALTPQPPTETAVRNQIEDERRDMLARRYMRDLRRAAFIDIRM